MGPDKKVISIKTDFDSIRYDSGITSDIYLH